MTASRLQHLELSVTDFGPIDRAQINVRSLTVFIGPNNTGKSYLAILLYALHQFFSRYPVRQTINGEERLYSPQDILGPWRGCGRFSHHRRHRLPDVEPYADEVPNDLVQNLSNWLDQITEALAGQETCLGQDAFSVPMPETIAPQVRTVLGEVGSFGKVIDAEISRCFGMRDTGELQRHGSPGKATVDIKQPVADHTESFTYEFALEGSDTWLKASIPPQIPLRLEDKDRAQAFQYDLNSLLAWLEGGGRNSRYPLTATELDFFLRQSVEALTFSPLHRKAHFLPADRAGVMQAHRVVTSSLIAQASRIGLQRELPSLPALSGVQTDFLA